MTKKIVILGGTGYIGSSLFFYLRNNGMDVHTVDLEWFGNYINQGNIVRDFSTLSPAFFAQYDVVILLAGHSSVQMCENNRLSVFKNNVANFVDLLGKLKDQKFIYASSSSLYAGQAGEATEVESSYVPTNYYDLSKKEIDLYAHISGLNYYALRFGTVNGPSLNLRTDLMINKMYESSLKNGEITIFNKDVRRPILGIRDLCRAINAIVMEKCDPGIYNVASFNETVGNIAQIVADETGGEVVDRGNSPTYDFHINTEKFCAALNFQFIDTTRTICKALRISFDKCIKSTRGSAKIYGM